MSASFCALCFLPSSRFSPNGSGNLGFQVRMAGERVVFMLLGCSNNAHHAPLFPPLAPARLCPYSSSSHPGPAARRRPPGGPRRGVPPEPGLRPCRRQVRLSLRPSFVVLRAQWFGEGGLCVKDWAAWDEGRPPQIVGVLRTIIIGPGSCLRYFPSYPGFIVFLYSIRMGPGAGDNGRSSPDTHRLSRKAERKRKREMSSGGGVTAHMNKLNNQSSRSNPT